MLGCSVVSCSASLLQQSETRLNHSERDLETYSMLQALCQVLWIITGWICNVWLRKVLPSWSIVIMEGYQWVGYVRNKQTDKENIKLLARTLSVPLLRGFNVVSYVCKDCPKPILVSTSCCIKVW